jgi:serine/threonine protein kinase
MGYDTILHRKVVLKVGRKGKQAGGAGGTHRSRAWKKELAKLKKLRHQHLVPLYEALDGPKSGQLCLVMGYVPYGSLLEDIQQNGKMSLQSVWTYFRCLVQAVGFSHASGSPHHAIGLHNMLLDSNHVLKLADLGHALIFEPKGGKELLPELFYYAPELCQVNPANKSFTTDIWALGVALYYLVEGRQPFAGRSVGELFESILTSTYPHILNDL